MSNAVELQADSFPAFRDAAGTGIVDFFATWCGPCRMMGPILDRFAEAHPEVRVGKIDVDACPDIAAEYRVSSIPCLVFFKDGQAVREMVGLQQPAALEAALREIGG
jgi:thioredoxin 1